MISAIVLAAGESRRMGRQKLLLPFGECTVIEHIVGQIVRSDVGETLVVVGHDAQTVASVLRDKPVTIVHNTDYRQGMLSSIRCGLRALAPEADAFMVVLGDQPNIGMPLVNALVSAYYEMNASILVPQFGDESGHPIIISSHHRDAILTQFDETGLRGLIRGNPHSVVRLPVDAPDVLRDMDFPDDYQRELQYRQR